MCLQRRGRGQVIILCSCRKRLHSGKENTQLKLLLNQLRVTRMYSGLTHNNYKKEGRLIGYGIQCNYVGVTSCTHAHYGDSCTLP